MGTSCCGSRGLALSQIYLIKLQSIERSTSASIKGDTYIPCRPCNHQGTDDEDKFATHNSCPHLPPLFSCSSSTPMGAWSRADRWKGLVRNQGRGVSRRSWEPQSIVVFILALMIGLRGWSPSLSRSDVNRDPPSPHPWVWAWTLRRLQRYPCTLKRHLQEHLNNGSFEGHFPAPTPASRTPPNNAFPTDWTRVRCALHTFCLRHLRWPSQDGPLFDC